MELLLQVGKVDLLNCDSKMEDQAYKLVVSELGGCSASSWANSKQLFFIYDIKGGAAHTCGLSHKNIAT